MLLAAFIDRGSAARFIAALSELRDGPATGHEAILLWFARLGIPHRYREDAAQDAIEAALRGWSKFDPEHPREGSSSTRSLFDAWMNAICVNIASHHRERAHVRREVLSAAPIASQAPDPTPLPSEMIALAERHDQLMADLAELARVNPEGAGVLIAHDIDGLPVVEIGEAMRLRKSAVYKVRAAGLAQLKALSRGRDQDD